jgi:hypothetical protein
VQRSYFCVQAAPRCLSACLGCRRSIAQQGVWPDANFKVTMDVYTQALTAIRQFAHDRAVRQIMDVPERGDKA